jgi:hypothetical protein
VADQFAQTAKGSGTTTAQATLSNVKAGATLVCHGYNNNNASPAVMTAADGQGSYTALGAIIGDGANGEGARVFKLENANAGSHTVTLTTDSGNACTVMLTEVSTGAGVGAVVGFNQAFLTGPGAGVDAMLSGPAYCPDLCTILVMASDTMSTSGSDTPLVGANPQATKRANGTEVGAWQLSSFGQPFPVDYIPGKSTAPNGSHNFLISAVAILNGPQMPNPTGARFDAEFLVPVAPENPVWQGGIFRNGLEAGVSWTDVKSIVRSDGYGAVVATQDLTSIRFSDAIAHLRKRFNAFGPDQWARGTVHLVPGYTGGGGSHEVELHLRFETTPTNARGYEILWGMQTGGGYLAVVRWNGALNSYTGLWTSGTGGSFDMPVDGDVLMAAIIKQDIYVWKNGVLVASSPANFTTDTTWTEGQPGFGFWPVDGAVPASYGWKRVVAGDYGNSPSLGALRWPNRLGR